jgi:hypothetical protein
VCAKVKKEMIEMQTKQLSRCFLLIIMQLSNSILALIRSFIVKRTTKRSSFTFDAVLVRSNNKLWGAHFGVPQRVASGVVDRNSRRVVCTLNDMVEFQCAMLPHGNDSFVITINKKIRDTLGLKFGMDVKVRLRRDESKYGLPMPEEFQELLRQDIEGNRLFQGLTPGKQRTLLYIIGSTKDQDQRLMRSLVVTRHLKENYGTIHYKQLNASLKKPHHQP